MKPIRQYLQFFCRVKPPRPVQGVGDESVNIDRLEALFLAMRSNPAELYHVAQKHWLNNLTEDEAMILIYWLNPSKVTEGTVQASALDRHSNLLPYWRGEHMPLIYTQPDLSTISSRAKQVLKNLKIT
jgi:hypothetical protein